MRGFASSLILALPILISVGSVDAVALDLTLDPLALAAGDSAAGAPRLGAIAGHRAACEAQARRAIGGPAGNTAAVRVRSVGAFVAGAIVGGLAGGLNPESPSSYEAGAAIGVSLIEYGAYQNALARCLNGPRTAE